MTAPSNRTVPPASTTTRSQSAATSSVWWVESSTVERWPEGGQRAPQVGALRRVEAGGRLVEHEDPRVAEQRLREPDPPALPAGQPADPHGGQVGEADQLEHPAHLPAPALAVVPLLEDGDVLDEAEGRHVGGVAELLRQVAELAAHRGDVGVGAVRVAPEQPHLAAVGGDRGGDDAQQRGLAGAVGAEQPGDASVEGEVDVGERAGAAVPLGDAGELDGGPRSQRHPPLPVGAGPDRDDGAGGHGQPEVDDLLGGLDRPGRG